MAPPKFRGYGLTRKLALSKTGRFLSKAEILGVGVFSPLSSNARRSASATLLFGSVVRVGGLQETKAPNAGGRGCASRGHLAETQRDHNNPSVL